MDWVGYGALIGAGAFGAVVLLFCGYETHWKQKRLQADLERFATLQAGVAELQDEIRALQRRRADMTA